MSSKLKICGVTSSEDALKAVSCGADFLGLIFVPASPRAVTPRQASLIAEAVRGECTVVGVFSNQAVHEVRAIAAAVALDMVQLHGQESPQYCASLDFPVIKTFELAPGAPFQLIESYSSCRYVLFDRPKGSIMADWLSWSVPVLKQSGCPLPPFFFAGGLTKKNVASVLSDLSPFGIDVASGVESEPGVKDYPMMCEFASIVKGDVRCI